MMQSNGHIEKVLILDDDELLGTTYQRVLEKAGYAVAVTSDVTQAREWLSADEYHVAVIDRVLSRECSGVDIIREMESLNPCCRSILVTGFPTLDSAVEILRYQAFAYLAKPVSCEKLCATVAAAAHDSHRKKQVETYLSLFASLFGALPNPVVVWDLEGRLMFINPAFTTVFGFAEDEVIGRTASFVPADDLDATRELFMRVVRGAIPPERETKRHTKSGHILSVSLSFSLCSDDKGKPSHVLEIIRDLTEQKKIERELLQVEKMSVIGQLAACLAHEISNPVQVISGYVELLLRKQGLDEENTAELARIQTANRIIQRLTHDLMEVARPRPSRISRFRPEEPLEQAIELLKSMGEIKYCCVEKNFDSSAPRVSGDAGQLQQVFINLIMNASHAIETSAEKKIVFTTNYDSDADLVFIAVQDSGCGIAPEHADKIFSPFFTTRKDRGGTGLGLPIIKGIVERNGGTIAVSSAGPEGTTFTVALPAPSESH